MRLCHRGLAPPAKDESAAKPVSVSVKTVVVRSGTPSLRAVAFLIPMARAVSPMTTRSGLEFSPPWITAASDVSAAVINNSPSTQKAQPIQVCCGRVLMLVANRPPATAPSMKKISAMDDLKIEKPGAPASANPRNTTLPVMFAVNTCPNDKMLTASTIPVVAVMPRRMYGGTESGDGAPCIL